MRAVDCPTCPRTALTAGTRACPTCGVDLTPIWRVQELADSFLNDSLSLAAKGDLDDAAKAAASAMTLDGGAGDARIVLGKLLWRRGHRDEAAQEWTRASQANPSDERASQLLQAAATVRRHAEVRRRLLLAASAIVFVLAGTVYLVRDRPRSLAAAPSPQSASPSPPSVVTDRSPMSERLESFTARFAQDSAVIVRRESNRAVVTVVGPLFVSGSDRLTASGVASITKIFDAVQADRGSLAVTVEGHTDDRPVRLGRRWKDNWELGMARATAVLAYLRRSNPSDPATMHIRSTADVTGPFPNDTAGSRDRNRTISFHVMSQTSATDGVR